MSVLFYTRKCKQEFFIDVLFPEEITNMRKTKDNNLNCSV